jgi:LemA protein
MKFAVLAAVALALLFGAKCIAVRKDLVSERQAIDGDWEQVNTALQHRAGLLPDLETLVRSDAPAQAPALQAVDEARIALSAASGQNEKIKANARLDQALARLMLQIENNSTLEAGKPYGDWLEALKAADYQIAMARRKYNEAVEHYNAGIDLFPSNIVASLARLRKVDAYFQTPAI